jgi:hypothetical protein
LQLCPPSSTSSPPALFFSLRRLAAFAGHVPSLSCSPRRPSARHVLSSTPPAAHPTALASPRLATPSATYPSCSPPPLTVAATQPASPLASGSPTRRSPAGRRPSSFRYLLPRAPRCPASARTPPAAASTCSRSPCLLLELKHVPELPVYSLLPSRTHICTAFFLPKLHASPEPRRCLGSPLTAASAASHPRSSAQAAPQQPTEAHKPAQFHSPALDHSDHSVGELEFPPPLGLAIVPSIHRLLTPVKHTTSTTLSRRSFPATSPPLSYPPATGTPSTSLRLPPPVSVRRRPTVSALLFPNTSHPCDHREPLKLSPHFPLAAGELPHRDLIGTDRFSCVAWPRTQLQGFESFQGPFCRKPVPPL